jgi:multidrug efflux system outer membrane protein
VPSQDAIARLAITGEGVAPSALPEVPTGLPSSLLDRRPDLRAAEANLAAAGADLKAARRAWFPNIVITGSAGEVSASLSSLFDDGLDIWSIGANVVQAVFDGGRRNAAINAADSRRLQLIELYRDTSRRAFGEVIDALDARASAAEVHRARSAQAEALATALRLAQRRYEEGYSDYLGVLDARRSLLQSRLAVAEAQRAGGAAYVDLVLAVGGGWFESR